MDEKLIRLHQDRIAELAASPSALRNQGNRRMVSRARKYLKSVDLSRFLVKTERRFQTVLDQHTRALKRAFPSGAKWGVARKTMNLFLRDVLYNRYLSAHFHFDRLERWLELPLDSYVAKGIRTTYLPDELPKWRGVKHLRPDENRAYQQAASHVATIPGVARVHLDLYWWRKD